MLRFPLVLVSALVACSSSATPGPTGAGAGGAAGASGESGAGGDVDGGSTVDVTTTDAKTGRIDAPDPLIIVRVDSIEGAPAIDAAPPVGQADTFSYTFDSSIEGWVVTRSLIDASLEGKSVAFSDDDVRGAASSGSLEARWTFPWDDSDPQSFRIRAFSAEGGAPRNWEGLRITAQMKKRSGPCPVNGKLYVVAGDDRKLVISAGAWLTSRDWQEVPFDLSPLAGLADMSRIYEFGLFFSRDLCVPP